MLNLLLITGCTCSGVVFLYGMNSGLWCEAVLAAGIFYGLVRAWPWA